MPKITITESEEAPQPYKLEPDHKIVHIGRSRDNDIVIGCRSVSTKHCTMERVKGGYILRDQDSTNGIKQDGSLMEIIDLEDGMELRVGDVLFKFKLSKDEIEKLEEEEFTPHQKKKLPPLEQEEKKEEGSVSEKVSGKSSVDKKPPQPQPQPQSSEPKASAGSPPAAYNPYRPQTTVQQSGNPLKTLFVFILVIAAVFTGMSIRHKMRTGESLPSKVMNWLNQTPAPESEKTEGSIQAEPPADEKSSPEVSKAPEEDQATEPTEPTEPTESPEAAGNEMTR